MSTLTNFIQYFFENITTIGTQLSEHIYLTFISVLVALLVGVPLGVSVYYYRKTSKLVLGFANVIQAIPSIALLGFLIPILGIGKLPAIVGVTLYSLLPIIKNTYLGVSGVRPETLEAAKGMGLTKAQTLLRIQIPIALPVIMGGIRIAAVTAVGMVTIAAFVGGGGLGTLIFGGIRTVNNNQVLLGAIPACILALLVDYLFGKIEYSLSARKLKKKKKNKKAIITGVVAIVAGVLIYNSTQEKYDITIASKDFSEQVIIANILSELVEAKTDLKVDRKTDLGGSNVVYQALLNKDVDMYIDYTGTVFINIMQQKTVVDNAQVFKEVSKFLAEKGVQLGNPIGFNNTYTLSTTKELAAKYNLKTISDLEKVAKNITLASTIEFANREDGLKGLKDFYGLRFNKVIPVDGAQRFIALNSKKADIIDAFSTDGLIKKFNLVSLEDDRNFFPPYYATPLINKATLKKHPELNDVLKLMENLISNEEMMQLNYLVDEKQMDPVKVAKDFLMSKKLLK